MKFDQWTRRALLMLATLAVTLSGCTTYVTTQVTAFSDWSGSDATRTYAFTRTAQQQNSIEQRTYEGLVANELETYAFRQTPVDRARYLVALTYGSHTDQMTVAQPVYYNYNPWPGPFWRPYDPWGPLGPFPPTYVNQTYAVFTHSLGIRITERATGKEVYNVTARNAGDEPSLVRAMPYLVRSALADFPLSNGAVRTVKLPVDRHGGVASNEVPVEPVAPAGPAAPAGASAPAAAKNPQ